MAFRGTIFVCVLPILLCLLMTQFSPAASQATNCSVEALGNYKRECYSLLNNTNLRRSNETTWRLTNLMASLAHYKILLLESLFENKVITVADFQANCSIFHQFFQCMRNITLNCNVTGARNTTRMWMRNIRRQLTFNRACNITTGEVHPSFKALLRNRDNVAMMNCLSGMGERTGRRVNEAVTDLVKVSDKISTMASVGAAQDEKLTTACRKMNAIVVIIQMTGGCFKTMCKTKYLMMLQKYVSRFFAIPGRACNNFNENRTVSFESTENKDKNKRSIFQLLGAGHIGDNEKYKTCFINSSAALLTTKYMEITGNFTTMVSKVNSSLKISFLTEVKINFFGSGGDCQKKKSSDRKGNSGKGNSGKGSSGKGSSGGGSGGQDSGALKTLILKAGDENRATMEKIKCDRKTIKIKRNKRANDKVTTVQDPCSDTVSVIRSTQTSTVTAFYVSVIVKGSHTLTGLIPSGCSDEIQTSAPKRRRRAASFIYETLGQFDASNSGESALLTAMLGVAEDQKTASELEKSLYVESFATVASPTINLLLSALLYLLIRG